MKQTYIGVFSLVLIIAGVSLFIATRIIARRAKARPQPATETFDPVEFADFTDTLSVEPTETSDTSAIFAAEPTTLATEEIATSAIERVIATPVEHHGPDAIAHEIRRVDVMMKF